MQHLILSLQYLVIMVKAIFMLLHKSWSINSKLTPNHRYKYWILMKNKYTTQNHQCQRIHVGNGNRLVNLNQLSIARNKYWSKLHHPLRKCTLVGYPNSTLELGGRKKSHTFIPIGISNSFTGNPKQTSLQHNTRIELDTSNCWSALAERVISVLHERGLKEAPRCRILSKPNCFRWRTVKASAWTAKFGMFIIPYKTKGKMK